MTTAPTTASVHVEPADQAAPLAAPLVDTALESSDTSSANLDLRRPQ